MIPRERVGRRVAVGGQADGTDVAGRPLGDGDATDGSDPDDSFTALPA